jgi:hypothetical protein
MIRQTARLGTVAFVTLSGVMSAQEGGGPVLLRQHDGVTWETAGTGLEIAYLEGKPDQAGPLTMLLRLQDGAWIPPHWHNESKRLLVMSGVLLLGMADSLVPSSAHAVPAGGFAVIQRGEWHFEGARGLTVVALTAEGPLRTSRAKPSVALTTPGTASRPTVIGREQEMTLALEAAPKHLRQNAGVYVLEESGYRRVRPSENGFTCIVNRDEPGSLKPTCFDREGTATIIPKIVRVGELLMRGRTREEIAADIADGFRTGRFTSPRRPGVAYMLSGHIRNIDAAGRASTFPPHLMFYAPNLSSDDIGVDPVASQEYPWLPFIGYQGPHGYIIVVPGDNQ